MTRLQYSEFAYKSQAKFKAKGVLKLRVVRYLGREEMGLLGVLAWVSVEQEAPVWTLSPGVHTHAFTKNLI